MIPESEMILESLKRLVMADDSLENTNPAIGDSSNSNVARPVLPNNPYYYFNDGLFAVQVQPRRQVFISGQVQSIEISDDLEGIQVTFTGAVSGTVLTITVQHAPGVIRGSFGFQPVHACLGDVIASIILNSVPIAEKKFKITKPIPVVENLIVQTTALLNDFLDDSYEMWIEGNVSDLDVDSGLLKVSAILTILTPKISTYYGTGDVEIDGTYLIHFPTIPGAEPLPQTYKVTVTVLDLWGQKGLLSAGGTLPDIDSLPPPNPLFRIYIRQVDLPIYDSSDFRVTVSFLATPTVNPVPPGHTYTAHFHDAINGAGTIDPLNTDYGFSTTAYLLGPFILYITDENNNIVSNIARDTIDIVKPVINIIEAFAGPNKSVNISGSGKAVNGGEDADTEITGPGLSAIIALANGTFNRAVIVTDEGTVTLTIVDHWGRTASASKNFKKPPIALSLNAVNGPNNYIYLSGNVTSVDGINAVVTFIGPVSVPGGQINPTGTGIYAVAVQEDHDIKGLETAVVHDTWDQEAIAYCQIDSKIINKIGQNISIQNPGVYYKPNFNFRLVGILHNNAFTFSLADGPQWVLEGPIPNAQLKGVSTSSGSVIGTLDIILGIDDAVFDFNGIATSTGVAHIIIGPCTLSKGGFGLGEVTGLYAIDSITLQPNLSLAITNLVYLDGTHISLSGRIIVSGGKTQPGYEPAIINGSPVPTYNATGCTLVLSGAASGTINVDYNGKFGPVTITLN